MGLFNRNGGNHETDEERFNRYKSEIVDANYLISLDLAVGTHGADEIVAGAMIGEVGKLIAMGNYGKTIWERTTIQLYDDCFQVHYNGAVIDYDTILGFDRGKKGFIDMEFVIHTTAGDWWFRAETMFAEAVMAVINVLKDLYLEKQKEETQLEEDKEKNQDGDDIDRLIRIVDLHEKGLLSDEEFAEAKKKLLGNKNEIKLDNVCPKCGAELVDGANFCTDCGYNVK